jgi:hypothetical protein
MSKMPITLPILTKTYSRTKRSTYCKPPIPCLRLLGFEYATTGSSVEMLDTSAASPTWVSKPNMPTTRGDTKAAVIGNYLYVVGGWGTQFTGALERLDTTTDTWTQLASLPKARGDAAVATYKGSLVVVGGEVWSGSTGNCSWDPSLKCNITEIPVHDVDQYDPDTDHWTPLQPLPTARFRFDGAVGNNGYFVFGGHKIRTVETDLVEALYLVDHPFLYVHSKN